MRHGATGEIGLDDSDRADGDMGNGTWRVPGRARRARRIDPASKKLALIAVGVSGALVLGVGLWSTIGHRSAVVPVIQADSRPIRVKPENPGGLQVNGTNDELMGDASPATSRLAPPAEAPAPNVLRAKQQEQPPAQLAKLEAPVPALADGPSVTETHPPISALPEKRAAPQTTQTAPAKGTLVQFAALGSEDAARAEWAHLAKRYPDLLGDRKPSFSKTERDGKQFWRVRTGGFADMAQATSFCEKARAKGASCSIASF